MRRRGRPGSGRRRNSRDRQPSIGAAFKRWALCHRDPACFRPSRLRVFVVQRLPTTTLGLCFAWSSLYAVSWSSPCRCMRNRPRIRRAPISPPAPSNSLRKPTLSGYTAGIRPSDPLRDVASPLGSGTDPRPRAGPCWRLMACTSPTTAICTTAFRRSMPWGWPEVSCTGRRQEDQSICRGWQRIVSCGCTARADVES